MISKIWRRGFWFTFAIIFNKVVPEFLFRFRYYTIFKLDANATDADANGDCRWVTDEQEIASVESLTGFRKDYSPGVNLASMVEVEKELVGGLWVAKEEFLEKELGIKMVLDADEAWVFSAFIRKESRGNKIFPGLLRFVCDSLTQQGSTRLFAAVNPLNKPSMAVFSKYSSDRVANVMVLRILSWVVCWTWGAAGKQRSFTFNGWEKPIEIRMNRDPIAS